MKVLFSHSKIYIAQSLKNVADSDINVWNLTEWNIFFWNISIECKYMLEISIKISIIVPKSENIVDVDILSCYISYVENICVNQCYGYSAAVSDSSLNKFYNL